MSLETYQRPGSPASTLRTGRPRKYDYTKLVQALADGKRINQLIPGDTKDGDKGRRTLEYMREVYDVQTTYQLIAHFLRNGWID